MSIYETRILPQSEVIKAHLKSGGTLTALAGILNVSVSSLRRCIKKHPELLQIDSSRRSEKDNAVENALFQRAVGFEQPDGKFVPPDVRAAMFWLKNRRPQEWSESRKTAALTYADLSDIEEEL